MTPQSNTLAIEQHSIDHIPEDERPSKPRNLLTLWFASNVGLGAAITGAISVFIGLNLGWAIFSVVAGNLVGGLFMAYHSVQGPRLGVPQMIQSRAQFGFAGACLPMAITVLMYLGFAVEGGVVAGQATSAITGLSTSVGIVVFNVVVMLIALVGHHLIHAVAKAVTVVSGLLFVALSVKLASNLGSIDVSGEVTWGKVLLAISICVSWQLTWAPYVSDYSRYLPADTSASKTFWYTYVGSAVGAAWVMSVGVLAACLGGEAFAGNPVGYVAGQFPGAGKLIIAAVLFALLVGGSQGPYGAFLTAFASVSTRGWSARSATMVRTAFVAAFTVVATLVSVLASADLVGTFQNITLFLLYLLVPWTAINLTDYYFVRAGNYSITALFQRDGLYGFCNWKAVGLYVVTMLIQVPFINSSLYVGPIAKAMGGADIAWIIGLVFPAVAYYLIAKGPESQQVPTTPQQVSASNV